MTSLDLQSVGGRYSVPHRLLTALVPNLSWESALAWMTGITVLGGTLPSLHAMADNAPIWSFAGVVVGGLLLILRSCIENHVRSVRRQLKAERRTRQVYEARMRKHNIPTELTDE